MWDNIKSLNSVQGMEQSTPTTPQYRGETLALSEEYHPIAGLARPDWPLGPCPRDNGKQSKQKKTVINIHCLFCVEAASLTKLDEPAVTSKF